MICPKCKYARKAIDAEVMEEICPSCGIVYQKWIARQALKNDTNQDNLEQSASADVPELIISPHYSLIYKIKNTISYVPERVDPVSFWARFILLILFFIWGWTFILGGISWESVGSSFLHNISLPFHEFGHVLFIPFGDFMIILGGSLFQVLMPLGIMLAFIFKQRDNFAASIMLWWSGQNFIDISPYISDAPYRAIPLINGLGEESHDWGNLLVMTGKMENAWRYAHISFNIGTGFMLISFIWGCYILYLQRQRLTTF